MDNNNKTSKIVNTGNGIPLLSLLCVSTCHRNSIIVPNGVKNPNDAFKIEVLENVFGNELILEEILTYAIHTEEGVLKPKLVKKVRSIQKSWLLTTTKLLKKLGKPVINLTLTKENSTNQIVKEKGKLLDRFIHTFTTSKGIVESAIPFKLNLKVGFFWKENYDSLIDCLKRLGCHLFELQVFYPVDGGTLPVIFPRLDLPSLTKLSFKFSHKKLIPEDDYGITFGNNSRGISLLQAILNASLNLKSFDHPFMGYQIIPSDFEFLWLPITISTLTFSVILKSSDLNILLRNDLPNLKYLKLLFHEPLVENNLLFKILEKFQKTLTQFATTGLHNFGVPRQHSYLRFPIMKVLETIRINGSECELGPGKVSNLHLCLPNLKDLAIDYQTEIELEKWIDKSRFKSVKVLGIKIVDEDHEIENDNYFISIGMDLMNKVNAAFPNIIDLTLTLNTNDLTGLDCLFQKMTQLENLRINLEGNLSNYSSDQFDSTVLCLPVTLAQSLREHCEHIKSVELRNKKETSIQNLAELTKLTLWTIPEDGSDSLLSDALIIHWLFRLPKLKDLFLFGRFKPTPVISKLWEDAGRHMEYFYE